MDSQVTKSPNLISLTAWRHIENSLGTKQGTARRNPCSNPEVRSGLRDARRTIRRWNRARRKAPLEDWARRPDAEAWDFKDARASNLLRGATSNNHRPYMRLQTPCEGRNGSFSNDRDSPYIRSQSQRWNEAGYGSGLGTVEILGYPSWSGSRDAGRE